MLGYVEDKVVNAEARTTFYLKNLRMREREQARYAHREGEREAQRISLFKKCNSYKILTTNLYKRLQSHFI